MALSTQIQSCLSVGGKAEVSLIVLEKVRELLLCLAVDEFDVGGNSHWGVDLVPWAPSLHQALEAGVIDDDVGMLLRSMLTEL